MTARFTALAIAFVATAGIPAAEALEGQDQESKILSNKLYLTVGGYAADFRTDAAIGTGFLFGTRISLEDDLGMEGDNRDFRFTGLWRFNRKHALDLGYVAFKRGGSSGIDEEISIGDETFPIGAELDSTLDTRLYTLNYQYSFFNNGKVNTGFAAGLNLFEFKIALEGSYTLGQTREFAEVLENVIAPIPSIGFFTEYAITPRLIVRVRAGFLDLSVGNYEGSMVDTTIVFDWFFTKHVGIGGGLARTDIDYSKLGERPYRVEYRYGGLLLYFGGVWGK